MDFLKTYKKLNKRANKQGKIIKKLYDFIRKEYKK